MICRLYYATYEKVLLMGGMGSKERTCDLILLYCSLRPLRNPITRSLPFFDYLKQSYHQNISHHKNKYGQVKIVNLIPNNSQLGEELNYR